MGSPATAFDLLKYLEIVTYVRFRTHQHRRAR